MERRDIISAYDWDPAWHTWVFGRVGPQVTSVPPHLGRHLKLGPIEKAFKFSNLTTFNFPFYSRMATVEVESAAPAAEVPESATTTEAEAEMKTKQEEAVVDTPPAAAAPVLEPVTKKETIEAVAPTEELVTAVAEAEVKPKEAVEEPKAEAEAETEEEPVLVEDKKAEEVEKLAEELAVEEKKEETAAPIVLPASAPEMESVSKEEKAAEVVEQVPVDDE
ncbi:hypothetical protein LguiA_025456 [Lonicera macranthoides]